MNAAVSAQAAGATSPIVDLRGGMFAVSAAITLTGTPYDISFVNGAIVPFGGFAGTFFDFSGTTATTDLRFFNLVINGYGQVATLIKMGPKTQGTFVEHCRLFGFTQYGFWDPTTAAGAENRIVNNAFQGGTTTNVGTAIRLDGNDSAAIANTIRNVATGIRTLAGSHLFALNHIYSIDANTPIPLVEANTASQMQVLGNYLDTGFVRFQNPSGLQLNDNRFLFSGTISAASFNPIILKPTSANAALTDFVALGNAFVSQGAGAPTYIPFRVDTSAGSIATCVRCSVDRNTFIGFQDQSTDPIATAPGSSASTWAYDFAAKVPFGTLKAVLSVQCSGATFSDIGSVGIGGSAPYLNTVYVNLTSAKTGSAQVRATVNTY